VQSCVTKHVLPTAFELYQSRLVLAMKRTAGIAACVSAMTSRWSYHPPQRCGEVVYGAV